MKNKIEFTNAPPLPRPVRLRLGTEEIDKIDLSFVDEDSVGDLTALTNSIMQHNLIEPITITADRELVNGYRRLKALEGLGASTIPVVFLAITAEKAAGILSTLRPERRRE